eukprot:136170_1
MTTSLSVELSEQSVDDLLDEFKILFYSQKLSKLPRDEIVIDKIYKWFTNHSWISTSLREFKREFPEFTKVLMRIPDAFFDAMVLPLIGINSYMPFINDESKEKIFIRMYNSRKRHPVLHTCIYNAETLMMNKLLPSNEHWNTLIFDFITNNKEMKTLTKLLPLIRNKSKKNAVCLALNNATLLLYKMKLMQFYRLKSKIYKYHTCVYCNKTDKKLENKYKMCSNCKKSFYCSRKCQKTDWQMHGYYCHVYQHMDVVSIDVLDFVGYELYPYQLNEKGREILSLNESLDFTV